MFYCSKRSTALLKYLKIIENFLFPKLLFLMNKFKKKKKIKFKKLIIEKLMEQVNTLIKIFENY